mgnify:CR=1 FL=1
MSSSVAASLWVAFSVGLLVGLWAEKAERRSPRDLAVSEWVPVALGLLRAELVCLLGLMVLLVLQPVSWVPFAVLVVVAAWVGRVRFMHVARQPRRWWQQAVVGAVLLVVWLAIVTAFQPETVSLDLRFSRACVVTFLACFTFNVGRFVAGEVAGAQGRVGRSDEYVAVPEHEGPAGT